jgi:hypothetical protein
MTIPSIRTLHGIARISVVLLLVIAVVTGQTRSNFPEKSTDRSALSRSSPEQPLLPVEKDRRATGSSLTNASVQLVRFGVDTFLELHQQDVPDDRKVAVPD